MVKTLYLVRHAHYRIPHPRADIVDDYVLTIKGIEDTIDLAHKLRHEDKNIQMIYSSPYQRTRETAGFLAKVLRTEEIQIRDKVQENHMGDGNIDHLKEVYANFKTVVEEALDYTEGNCIIVSHRMPISLYVSKESGHPYQEIIDNTKYNAVLKMGDCLKLLYNRKSFIKYEKF